MVKERLFIVVFFSFFLVTNGFGQKFNYNSQKKQTSEYNEELSTALRNDDANSIRRILTKNPSLVDAASYSETSKRLKIKTSVPLIWDAVQRCLDRKCSVKVVETILEFHPNLNCKFDGLPPFYLVLDYLARHKTSECDRAKELFFSFLNKTNIDIKERPAELPPSFSYLLTENYNHLHGKFSKDYISSDIIKAFVDRGASINTKDVNSNSILTFATLTQNQELVNYCLGEGANVASTNKAGKDALYYAVENNNYASVKTILESDYPLSEKRIAAMDMKQVISKSGNEIQNLLFDKLRVGEKNFSELQTLFAYFPNQKGRFFSQGFQRSQLNVNRNELSEVIDMVAQSQLDNVAAGNLEALKKEYIIGAENLGSFAAAIGKYPIRPFHFSKNYYENQTTQDALLSDLQSLKSDFPASLIDRLCQEANDRKKSFIDSDWKGNPTVGKKVVDGYPYMYDKVVSELYKEISGMYLRSTNYSYENSSTFMKDELNTLNGQIRYCDDFIRCFGNSSYVAQARDKRNALNSRSNYVQSALDSWRSRLDRARSKYYELEKYILDKGGTPSYKMGEWDYYEEFVLFGPNTKCHRAKCEVDARTRNSYSFTFYVSSCEDDDGYDIEEMGFLGGYSSVASNVKSISAGIRKALWNKIIRNSQYTLEDNLIDLVSFLETHKDSNWWGYKTQ